MNINIVDKTLTPVGIMDVFDSLLWVDKYVDIGTLELIAKLNSKNFTLLQQDYILSIKETDQNMIIDTFQVESDIENGDKIKVKGRSLTSILERRIIWEQTSLSGNFQDAIESLLTANIINPTESDRKISNFIFSRSTDPLITSSTINEQFYGDNLLAVIQTLCEARDIGFKIILNNSNQFVFSLYVGADRSLRQFVNPHVIFSPDFDNLLNSDYLETNLGSVTVTLVGGEGDGSSQKVRIVESPNGPGNGMNRREGYTDASDISSNTSDGVLTDPQYQELLQARGESSLAELSPISELGATVDTTVSFIYGQDYFLGDIVQAKNAYGIEGSMRVVEYTISEDVSGYQVYPTFQML